MRMRQSLAELEHAFHEQSAEELQRRTRLRRDAAVRSRARRARKVEKRGTLRFVALIAAILATSALVTVAMFETLALLIDA